MAGALAGNLGAALEFFVHLAIVLVPLFVGGAFLVGLLQESPPRPNASSGFSGDTMAARATSSRPVSVR